MRDLLRAADRRETLPAVYPYADVPDGGVLDLTGDQEHPERCGYYQRQLDELVPVAPDERGEWPCAVCGVGARWCRSFRRPCCPQCAEHDQHAPAAWGLTP